MRSSVVLLLCSLAGIILGAALIGRWAVGVAVIADSVAVGVYALRRDDGTGPAPSVREAANPALEWVFERSRRAS